MLSDLKMTRLLNTIDARATANALNDEVESSRRLPRTEVPAIAVKTAVMATAISMTCARMSVRMLSKISPATTQDRRDTRAP